jgi:hypothetical protein
MMEAFQLLDNHPLLGDSRVKRALDSLGYRYGHTTVRQMVALDTKAPPPHGGLQALQISLFEPFATSNVQISGTNLRTFQKIT